MEEADAVGVAVTGDAVGEGVSAGVGAGKFGSWVTDEDAVALGVLDRVTELVGDGVPVTEGETVLVCVGVCVRVGVPVLVLVAVCDGVGGDVIVGVMGRVGVAVYALLGVGDEASCVSHPAVTFTVCAHALVKLDTTPNGCMYELKKTSLAPARYGLQVDTAAPEFPPCMLKMVTACTNVGAPKSICTHVSDTLPGDVVWYGPAVSAVSVVDAWLLA